MSKTWIKTAWASDNHAEVPWLVASFDEFSADTWGGTPDHYTDAVDSARKVFIVRELVVEIDHEAVRNLFTTPTITGTVKDGVS